MLFDRSGSILSVRMWLTVKDALIGLLLSSFLINVLGLTFPLVLLQVYDRIIPNQSNETMTMLILIVAGALFFETVLKIMRAYVSSWSNARFTYNVDRLMFKKLVYSDLPNFEQKTAGVHLEKFNSAESLREFYCGQNLVMLVDLPFILIYVALLAFVNKYIALVPIIIIIIMVIFSGNSQPLTQKKLVEKNNLSETKSKFLIEMISGIHTIKSLGMEEQFLRRYERLHQQELLGNYELIQRQSQSQRMAALFSQLVVIFTAALGGYLVVQQLITVGGLAASIMLSGKVLQPVSKIIAFWEKKQSMDIARNDMKNILSHEREYPENITQLEDYHGDLELRNMSFRHKGASKDLFSHLNLKVSAKKVVVIHGDGLAGKSTLLALMCGLFKPTEGEVFYDGMEMSKLDLDHFRRHIAYMPQDGELFSGNILDNLTMFEQDKYTDKAKEISHDIGLYEVIEAMPNGFQTDVGKGTVDLISTGQKQQILAVRALLGNPKLILFDEANMAMDIESDIKMRKFLLSKKGLCTIVLVTHRPSLLEMADIHYELKDGKLVEIKWA